MDGAFAGTMAVVVVVPPELETPVVTSSFSRGVYLAFSKSRFACCADWSAVLAISAAAVGVMMLVIPASQTSQRKSY